MSSAEHHNCVLITGATSGIGNQLAKDYADEGYFVWACGRNFEQLGELEEYSNNIRTIGFDISDLESTKLHLESLSPEPSLWIFNAGTCEYIDDGRMDAELVGRVFSANVQGLVNSIEATQPMYRSGHRIAVVGSIASELALPRAEAYGASKAAVSYIARALAVDLKNSGVNVTTIFPGFVKTPLTDKNTFSMPMIVSVKEASLAIRNGIKAGKSNIYFPKRFTSILRAISLLPYEWQSYLVNRFVKEQ
ncbi:SDR family NAD(P)-dependent oxidoreductase [Vibrio hannami]|uniref:SDR family NAD(P)-dependent oxidoreductase n=1 Tax=Vibrio hannami TaxID=2717094 RepID=UPI0024109F7A|nr:SDR family NAD(P)-dependent oxidoreductase [Vibrio hannami]MDG3087669.1 SDR family NAD(P)-dependent oxidoreductase [Vibrio hannami]